MKTQDLFALFYGVFFASMLSSCFGLSLFQWGWICRSAHKTLRLIISIVLLNVFPAIYFAWVYKNLGEVSTALTFQSSVSVLFLGLSVFGFYRTYHLLISRCKMCLYEQDEIDGNGKQYEGLSKRLEGIGSWKGQAISVIFYFGLAYLGWIFGVAR